MRTVWALALLVACGETAPTAATPAEPPPVVEPASPVEPAVEAPAPVAAPAPTAEPPPDPDVPPPPAPSRADGLALAAGLRGFSAALFRQAAGTPTESAAIAPLSIAAALSMTAAGARGASQAEVWSALGVEGMAERAPAVVAGALGALRGEELAVANRVFASGALTIEPAFVELTRTLFASPIETLDFAASGAAIERINRWVSQRTHTRIPEILPAGSVDSTTAMVLVNAMYFLAAWQTPFEENETRDDYFHAPGGRVTCRMMNRQAELALGSADGATVLALPYAGGRFVASFVLPEEGGTLEALERTMTGAILGHWLEAPRIDGEVAAEIPRFRVASDAPTALDEPLQALGVRTMFGSSADFGGIAAPGAFPLYLQHVFHRVFVETTERGTEAAAATGVSVGIRGMRIPSEPRRFRADRPFLFFVTERESGLVLFMARVATPGSPE